MYIRVTARTLRKIEELQQVLGVVLDAEQAPALDDLLNLAVPDTVPKVRTKALRVERAYLEKLEALQEEIEALQRRLERADLWKPCPKCGMPLDRAEGDA